MMQQGFSLHLYCAFQKQLQPFHTIFAPPPGEVWSQSKTAVPEAHQDVDTCTSGAHCGWLVVPPHQLTFQSLPWGPQEPPSQYAANLVSPLKATVAFSSSISACFKWALFFLTIRTASIRSARESMAIAAKTFILQCARELLIQVPITISEPTCALSLCVLQ